MRLKLSIFINVVIMMFIFNLLVCAECDNYVCDNEDCDGLPLDITECCSCIYNNWDDDLKEYTESLCEENDIPYKYVLGIIYNESRFQSDVISEHGGYYNYGLMQINGITFDYLREEIGIEDEEELLNPKTNILAGITLLVYHREFVNSNKHMILRYQLGATNYEELIQSGKYSIPALERVLDKADQFDKFI